MFFTQKEAQENPVKSGVETFVSKLKHDTMLIENAIARGAREIHVLCDDVEKSWQSFAEQFIFVQAAGGLVKNTKGELLFIYRLEKWDLPKGKVEKGEKLDEAAIREVEEECSITGLELHDLLLTTWHTYIQNGEPMLKATAWYRMNYNGQETPRPQTIEGITETRWINPSDLSIVLENTYASVVDVVESSNWI